MLKEVTMEKKYKLTNKKLSIGYSYGGLL